MVDATALDSTNDSTVHAKAAGHKPATSDRSGVESEGQPDGTGAIVNASRSVIYAFEEIKYLENYASEWEKCIEAACRDFVTAVNGVVAV